MKARVPPAPRPAPAAGAQRGRCERGSAAVLLCCGAVGLRCCGAAVLWCCCAAVLQCCCAVVWRCRCAAVLQCCCAAVLRACGTVVLWCCGAVVLWCCGAAVLQCCCAVVLLCCGAAVLQRCCAAVPWCRNAAVLLCCGAVVPRCRGAAVLWCGGAAAPGARGLSLPRTPRVTQGSAAGTPVPPSHLWQEGLGNRELHLPDFASKHEREGYQESHQLPHEAQPAAAGPPAEGTVCPRGRGAARGGAASLPAPQVFSLFTWGCSPLFSSCHLCCARTPVPCVGCSVAVCCGVARWQTQ